MFFRRILPIILIIVGLSLIAVPFYGKYKIKENMKNATTSIEEVKPEQLKQNDERVIPQEHFDFEKIDEISPTSTFLSSGNIDKSLLIGQIVVPSVNMNLSIFKGSTNDNLLAGVATMKPEDKMGEQNFTLAGHYNKDKSILFGALMDVKVDDIVRVTDKTYIYEYKIYDTRVVDDTALYMIDNEESAKRGNAIISLMTCYHSSKTGKRYFALGDLVQVYPYSQELMNMSLPKKE